MMQDAAAGQGDQIARAQHPGSLAPDFYPLSNR